MRNPRWFPGLDQKSDHRRDFIRGRRSRQELAFTLGGREDADPARRVLARAEAIRRATESSPFCVGNEGLAPREVFRMTADEIPEWNGAKAASGAAWVVRVINNLFPRIPAELTGNRNESYIVVEDATSSTRRARR